jgi:polysaccharide pyruvyl transferase WcaK-like protein
MFIEVRGVGFVNKGAELMLYAVLDYLKKNRPDAKVVMERRRKGVIKKHRKLGVYTKFKFVRLGLFGKFCEAIIPTILLNKILFAKESQIHFVLDASGYAYADFLGGGIKPSTVFVKDIIRWKTDKKKIILLPQAFGPFNDRKLRAEMNQILKYSDLVFARDTESLKYLETLEESKATIDLKPDFTNLLCGSIPGYFDPSNFDIAIIPNVRMVTATSEAETRAYPLFIKNVVESLQEMGEKPFFLIHEGEKDENLTEKINKSLSKPLVIIKEDNPLHIKGMIGECKMVVTSRFHGLVSALSQAIPCLTTSWSHKYKELLSDYGFESGLCELDLSAGEIKKKLNQLLMDESRSNLIVLLKTKSEEQKKKTIDMWRTVMGIITK